MHVCKLSTCPPPVEVPAVASVCRVVSMCMYSYKEGVPGENSSGHMRAQETGEPTPRGRPPPPPPEMRRFSWIFSATWWCSLTITIIIVVPCIIIIIMAIVMNNNSLRPWQFYMRMALAASRPQVQIMQVEVPTCWKVELSLVGPGRPIVGPTRPSGIIRINW